MHVQPLFSAEHHPILITPSRDCPANALAPSVAERREQIDRFLLEHGAVLFRGFEVAEPAQFRTAAESLGASPFDYVGGDSPRSRVALDVYTSTDYPASEVISLHNEMSYLPQWPRRIFFYCATPARSGGQTPLAHGRDVLEALPTSLVSRLREKRITYVHNFHARNRLAKSWQTTYATQDRAEAERIITAHGSSYRWYPDGGLRVTTVCDALTAHPLTGEKVWFNQAEQFHPSALAPDVRHLFEQMLGKGRLPLDCEYGDGEPLEEELLAEIRRALARCKLIFDWQRGDILMIDNVLMMHGRESFEGERSTLAYLSTH